MVDASISTPLLVRPLEHGAAVVVHSLSKYVGGHGDLIGGIAVGGGPVMARLARQRTLTGAVMDPFCAWLALRGLRTLARAAATRQCATAAALARGAGPAPAGARGALPRACPATRIAPAAGGCWRPRGRWCRSSCASGAAARRFYDRVRLITRAASFGEVTILLTHPATFSHKGLSPAERARLGIDDGLLRLSVGLEDPADLRGGHASRRWR